MNKNKCLHKTQLLITKHRGVSQWQLLSSLLLHCPLIMSIYLSNRWLNKLGLASIQYQPTEQTTAVGKHARRSDAPHRVWPVDSFSEVSTEPWPCVRACVFDFLYVYRAECYSEASDQEEAESTEIPPPPYSEQTLRDSAGVSGPPGSTHQVSQLRRRLPFTRHCIDSFEFLFKC